MMIRALPAAVCLLALSVALAELQPAYGTEPQPVDIRIRPQQPVDLRDATLTTHAADGSLLPATTLDFSLLGNDGKDIKVEAKTDPFGNLRFGYVPWNEWTAQSAFRGGTLQLPDNTFGSVGVRGAGPSQQTFAIQNGRFVDPARYASNLVAPFSLLCRSDEGAPKALSTGDRYAFEVLGDQAALKWVLAKPYVIASHTFRLPAGRGYGVTSAAGANASQTWFALEGLVRTGSISNLERDPCWLFQPESGPSAAAGACVPGVREYPEKAVRYSGSFGSSLLSSYTQLPVADAIVLSGPLSPSPFWDPGYRFGDEGPPTFVRSGPGGTYTAPLQGLGGPIEIGVAKGCDEHTTVAIVDGPTASGPGKTPATQTRPGASETVVRTPPAPTPVNAPPTAAKPEKPGPNATICGPDVTDYVLDVLRLLEQTYNAWDSATRASHCGMLYSRRFNAAWDMQGFAPSERGENVDPGQPGYVENIFLQVAAPGYCAIPREKCGATVKFMGYCLSAQVVNYLQWGLMNQMCGDQLFGRAALLARSLFSPDSVGQGVMSVLGENFGAIGGDIATRKERMKKLMDALVRVKGDSWYGMDGTDCDMKCDEVATGAKSFMDNNFRWGFQWGDTIRTINDERLERQAEEAKRRRLGQPAK